MKIEKNVMTAIVTSLFIIFIYGILFKIGVTLFIEIKTKLNSDIKQINEVMIDGQEQRLQRFRDI